MRNVYEVLLTHGMQVGSKYSTGIETQTCLQRLVRDVELIAPPPAQRPSEVRT